jgi:diketogulonate reductase-like aldo/keto reductase
MNQEDENRLRRRRLMQALIGCAAVALAGPRAVTAAPQSIRKPIPSSGELLPVIGMGSWLTFDVGDNVRARAVRTQVLQAFFDHGGALIDSSPMYGSSQEVIGHALAQVSNKSALFAATKVWILGKGFGIRQMEDARRLWGVPRFDLMQVHNLLDWETHLETLKVWKAEGRVRYIGVTTSHGRRHDEMEQVMKSEPLDFVQFTYNILDREAESRLLPLAAERGIAVIVNRPFQRGSLFSRLRGQPLPPWAAEFDCANWAQYLLKFVVSHPAVTCAIPATSRVDHMVENMGAGSGRLPDAAMRRRMVAHFESL